MLSIQPTRPQKCTPNLLPARINHNGPINNSSQYWKPTTDSTGTHHVHFRGRHLHGSSTSLPSNYTGAVLQITDNLAPLPKLDSHAQTAPRSPSLSQADGSADEEDDVGMEEVKIAEQVGEFDEIVIWGHGGEVDGGQDVFVRGVKEWVGFAESMHVDDDDEEEEKEKDGDKGEKSA